jgi:hypothetical protein
MAIFQQLCAVSVEHAYFADGRCRGLAFVPTQRTLYFINKTGLLIKHTTNGIAIFYETSRIETLRQFFSDVDEPFSLAFKVFSRAPDFSYYTQPVTFKEDASLYFDNQGTTPDDESGVVRLHPDEYVTDQNFVELGSQLLVDIINKKDILIRPVFVVNIGNSPSISTVLSSGQNSSSCNFCIKFQARETFWKYYLLGEMKKKNAFISDRNNGFEFEYVGEELLPDNRAGIVFISKQLIPVREMSDCYFQLKEKGVGGDRILIKRLPVATPNQFSRKIIDGQEAAVSDIYINC